MIRLTHPAIQILLLLLTILTSTDTLLQGQNVSKIPIETFFRISDKGSLDICPKGKFYSYTAEYKNKKNLFIENCESGSKKRITSYTHDNVRSYAWFNDSLIVIRRDNQGDENYHLYLVNIETMEEKDLTPFERPFAEGIEVRKGRILTVMSDDSARGYFAIDPLNDSIPRLLTKSLDLGDENFVFDNNDVIRIIYGQSETGDRVLYYRESASDTFRTTLITPITDQLIPKQFCSDNTHVYCFSNLNRDKFALVEFEPTSCAEVKVVYENSNYDINDEIYFDQNHSKLIYLTFIDWKRQYHFLDTAAKEEFQVYFNRFPESNVNIIRRNRNGKSLLLISADKNPGEYFLYHHDQKTFTKIAEVNSEIDKALLCSTIPINYKTRDGLTIHGYLTIPKDKVLKELPTVAFAHGGPWTRDEWSYNNYFQFLANRGYLVFYMDFRGSRGYGKKHYTLSFKAWDKMCDDIADGLYWLIDQGITDRNKIAISGSSWGGFAANYSMVFYPNLYKCGIVQCGPSNLHSIYNSLTGFGRGYTGIFNSLIGNPATDSLYFNRISPLLHIHQLQNPLLIWQGKNDPRVPWQEAQQMYDAAIRNGIAAELILKEDEGHNISNVNNRIEFYRRVEHFLEKNLE